MIEANQGRWTRDEVDQGGVLGPGTRWTRGDIDENRGGRPERR